MRTTIIALALTLLAHAVNAATPENGWWWNPQEPGSGYNIEIQEGMVFIATSVYDDEGHPVWYSGSGQMDPNERVTMRLLRSEGGPCLGCSYISPQSFDSGHSLVITFNSETTATVSLDGDRSTIERFNFALGSGVNRLLGVWTIVFQVTTDRLGHSDAVTYYQINDGMAIGFRSTGVDRVNVARPIGEGDYLSLMDLAGGDHMAMLFWFEGLNRIAGVSAIVDSDATTKEILNELKSGLPVVGFRYSSLAALENLAQGKQASRAEQADVLSAMHKVQDLIAQMEAER
ncbi:hypothetical protein [Nitrosococcus wardiae]|uniref:Uncharacterized protein n=1 Tax=Nitrosococcus wardiae TaxID=1814290 RepID=A0A4P7BZA6_9GAMM|nr:hypothetical protein [Nitrosococcus wardiae]QBQ53852.1 hypothetical protein E3U44_04490 [Nitrosococcus wardiae]